MSLSGVQESIIISETFVCPENYFKCRGSFCLDAQYVCDGISQCADGQDEDSCGMYAASRKMAHPLHILK